MGSQLDFRTTLKKNNLLETSTVIRYNIQLIKCYCLWKQGSRRNCALPLEGFPLVMEQPLVSHVFFSHFFLPFFTLLVECHIMPIGNGWVKKSEERCQPKSKTAATARRTCQFNMGIRLASMKSFLYWIGSWSLT